MCKIKYFNVNSLTIKTLSMLIPIHQASYIIDTFANDIQNKVLKSNHKVKSPSKIIFFASYVEFAGDTFCDTHMILMYLYKHS